MRCCGLIVYREGVFGFADRSTADEREWPKVKILRHRIAEVLYKDLPTINRRDGFMK